MKMISWNCNGAFRNKTKNIQELNPDILIVQECEHVSKIKMNCHQSLWFGDDDNRGIGVFLFNANYSIEELPRNDEFKWIIPLQVSGPSSFVLFAVWTKDTPENKKLSYIGQLYLALHHYYKLLDVDVVIMGDFNSSVKWDKKPRIGNHSKTVEYLRNLKIYSAYHHVHKEKQGEETEPTYYMYRNQTKPYHIDYCFASKTIIGKTTDVLVGTYEDWISDSDHCPITIQFDDI